VKRAFIVLCLCLLLFGLTPLAPVTALAQESSTSNQLQLSVVYPKVSGLATSTFTFEVELRNLSEEARYFDLVITGPTQWSIDITPASDTSKKISAIRLEPIKVVAGQTSYGQSIAITATPPAKPVIVEPREYTIKLDVSSGDIKASTELVAVITATYSLKVVPVDGLYNTKANAGKNNWYPVNIQNTGTDAINNIDFLSDKTEGWRVGVSLFGIETLNPQESREVGLTIIPAAKSIPGDYYISFWVIGQQAAAGEQVAGSIDIRVTVEAATVWGWLGLIIIVLIVAGLGYLYVAFRRR
jgi:uncharacterized membrane protein